MNKDEKLSFVNKMCMGLALEVGELIENGKVPDNWDGHELRAYLAEKM